MSRRNLLWHPDIYFNMQVTSGPTVQPRHPHPALSENRTRLRSRRDLHLDRFRKARQFKLIPKCGLSKGDPGCRIQVGPFPIKARVILHLND